MAVGQYMNVRLTVIGSSRLAEPRQRAVGIPRGERRPAAAEPSARLRPGRARRLRANGATRVNAAAITHFISTTGRPRPVGLAERLRPDGRAHPVQPVAAARRPFPARRLRGHLREPGHVRLCVRPQRVRAGNAVPGGRLRGRGAPPTALTMEAYGFRSGRATSCSPTPATPLRPRSSRRSRAERPLRLRGDPRGVRQGRRAPRASVGRRSAGPADGPILLTHRPVELPIPRAPLATDGSSCIEPQLLDAEHVRERVRAATDKRRRSRRPWRRTRAALEVHRSRRKTRLAKFLAIVRDRLANWLQQHAVPAASTSSWRNAKSRSSSSTRRATSFARTWTRRQATPSESFRPARLCRHLPERPDEVRPHAAGSLRFMAS